MALIIAFILNLYSEKVSLPNRFSDDGLSMDRDVSCLMVWLHCLLLHLKLTWYLYLWWRYIPLPQTRHLGLLSFLIGYSVNYLPYFLHKCFFYLCHSYIIQCYITQVI